MKYKNIYTWLLLGMMTYSFASCAGWVEVEPENIDKLLADADSAMANANRKYFEDLRTYKKSKHSVTFGWFGGWTANGPASCFISQLPDSTDLISIWGGWSNMNADKIADMEYARKVKGLKVMTCALLFDIGKDITPSVPADFGDKNPGVPADQYWEKWSKGYWGWVDGKEDVITQSIIKYANALCDTIFKYDFDGFDLDAEPSYAQPFKTNKEMWRPATRMYTFIETMAKRIGPMAETEEGRNKLLVVDGEPDWFPAKYGPYFDYFILQTYGCRSNGTLEMRFNELVRHFAATQTPEQVAEKLIVCEEFEKWGTTGGVEFTTPEGKKVRSYLGMAAWNPGDGKYRKGGIGSYHMEIDYAATPAYKYLREGIQIMNPAGY